MRIHRVRVSNFKGLDVEFPWVSAMVLFGANDSGKTNILEGLMSNLGAERAMRTEPFLPERSSTASDWADVYFDVELDGLDIEGHPDQEIYLSLLFVDDAERWWMPQFDYEDDEAAEADEAVEFEELALWADIAADYARLEHETERAGAVAQLVRRARETVCDTRNRRVALCTDAERLRLESGAEAFQSNWFIVGADRLSWASPNDDGRLGRDLGDFFLFIDHGPGNPLTESFHNPLNIRVVHARASRETFTSLYDRLEHFLESFSRYRCRREAMDAGGPVKLFEMVVNDLWVERIADSISLRPIVGEACASLAACVNVLAPPFVSDSYEIGIVPLFPDEWHAYGGRHVAVRLRPRSQSEDFDLALASSGIAAWTSYALSEAIRLMEDRCAADLVAWDGAGHAGTSVYVFDEPEAHLHPLAQDQAAAWVAERARTGAHVLMATHAVPFLRLPLGDVEYLKVTRSPEWQTTVEPITGDILGAVAESAAALGLPPAALIQLTRAWLVVEGEHDRQILDAFHGQELRQAGVQILPLRGAARAKASFLNLAALGPLGLPFCCLLDNTRAEAVRTGTIGVSDMTDEERIAEQLIRFREQHGVDLEVLGLPYPDIICALPIEAVRHIARENRGKPEAASAWSDLIERHQAQRADARESGEKALDFKRFVLRSLGLDSWSPDRLVAEALGVCEGQPPQASPLSRVVSQVVASVNDRPFDAD